MTQVYVVTSGEYSDYGINSIWLTREEAERKAGDWGRVEVWPIGENERTLGSFRHYADLDGATGEVLYEDVGDSAHLNTEPRRTVCCWENKNTIGIRVDQETRERADKVFTETKARVLTDITMGLPKEAIAQSIYRNGAWHDLPRVGVSDGE